MLWEGVDNKESSISDLVAETSRTWIHNAKMIGFKYVNFCSIGFLGIKRYYLATTSNFKNNTEESCLMLKISYKMITHENREQMAPFNHK
jgi:hypothetical protein